MQKNVEKRQLIPSDTREKPRPSMVHGTKDGPCRLRAGPIKRELFVFRGNKEHDAEDIRMYLNDEQIDLDETECVCNDNSYTRSFHIILSAKNADKLLTPAFWPESIML